MFAKYIHKNISLTQYLHSFVHAKCNNILFSFVKTCNNNTYYNYYGSLKYIKVRCDNELIINSYYFIKKK